MNNITVSPRVSHKLLATPQIRQALYLLQLPFKELRDFIKQNKAENPLIQPPDDESLETKIQRLLDLQRSNVRKTSSLNNADEAPLPLPENQKAQNTSLEEYLLHQLETSFLSKEDAEIAQTLINHIDANGYLRIDLDKIAAEYGYPLEKIENILKAIQSFEPSGIAARNLQECLLIQLRNNEEENSISYRIIQSCFKDLTRKKYGAISKSLDVSDIEIKQALKRITSLNPKPGTIFTQTEITTIVPDILVDIKNGRLDMKLTETGLPELKINSSYLRILNNPNTPDETRHLVKERLKNALWLINALKERQKNSQTVFRAILNAQKKALIKGVSFLRPLTLKDVSRETGLHISTVARIISGKYLSTPQGTIKAKNLFSSKLSVGENSTISSGAIQAKIKSILGNNQKHLTDQAVAEILRGQGIKISRRTITKYRNKLKLPPAYLR